MKFSSNNTASLTETLSCGWKLWKLPVNEPWDRISGYFSKVKNEISYFFCNLTSDCTWPANAWHLLLRLRLVKVIASKSNDQVNRCDSATHVRHAETLVFNRWKRVTYTPTGSVLGVGRAGQLHHTWNACWFQHSKTDSGQAWSRSDYHVSGQ